MRFIGLLVALAGCSSTPVREVAHQIVADPGELPELGRIIDAHTHLDEMKQEEGWNAFYEASVVATISHAPQKNPIPNNAAAPLPVIRCAAISETVKVAEVEGALKDGRAKCMKVYLGYIPRWAYDPRYKQFYRLAEKYKIPVVFHTGDTYDKKGRVKYADPLTIDEVAVDFPRVNFVLAHMGNPWFASAAEVVYKNDNVYADTSALMLGDVETQKPESVDELITKPVRWFYLYVENPKKILFGSDWPLLKIKSYAKAIQKAIPKEAWDDVFYGNAVRVFNIKNSDPMIGEIPPTKPSAAPSR